jgi:hypothetical protein
MVDGCIDVVIDNYIAVTLQMLRHHDRKIYLDKAKAARIQWLNM